MHFYLNLENHHPFCTFAHFTYHKYLGKCREQDEWELEFWYSQHSFLFRHIMKLGGHETAMKPPFQNRMPFPSGGAWLVDSTEPWLPSGASSAFATPSGGWWHLWTVMLALALQTASPVPCSLPWIRKAHTLVALHGGQSLQEPDFSLST